MIQFFMRCNRSIDGEQQVNDQTQGGKLTALATREFTLVSTDDAGAPFESHVQYATMSATLLFPAGFDSTEHEKVRRGKRVRVTVEVVEDDAPNPQSAAAQISGATPADAGTSRDVQRT